MEDPDLGVASRAAIESSVELKGAHVSRKATIPSDRTLAWSHNDAPRAVSDFSAVNQQETTAFAVSRQDSARVKTDLNDVQKNELDSRHPRHASIEQFDVRNVLAR